MFVRADDVSRRVALRVISSSSRFRRYSNEWFVNLLERALIAHFGSGEDAFAIHDSCKFLYTAYNNHDMGTHIDEEERNNVLQESLARDRLSKVLFSLDDCRAVVRTIKAIYFEDISYRDGRFRNKLCDEEMVIVEDVFDCAYSAAAISSGSLSLLSLSVWWLCFVDGRLIKNN